MGVAVWSALRDCCGKTVTNVLWHLKRSTRPGEFRSFDWDPAEMAVFFRKLIHSYFSMFVKGKPVHMKVRTLCSRFIV